MVVLKACVVGQFGTRQRHVFYTVAIMEILSVLVVMRPFCLSFSFCIICRFFLWTAELDGRLVSIVLVTLLIECVYITYYFIHIC